MPGAYDHDEFAKQISRVSAVPPRSSRRSSNTNFVPSPNPELVQPPMKYRYRSQSLSSNSAATSGMAKVLGVWRSTSSGSAFDNRLEGLRTGGTASPGSAFSPNATESLRLDRKKETFMGSQERSFAVRSLAQQLDTFSAQTLPPSGPAYASPVNRLMRSRSQNSIASLPTNLPSQGKSCGTPFSLGSPNSSIPMFFGPGKGDDEDAESKWLISELQQRARQEAAAREEAEMVIASDRRRLKKLEQQLESMRSERGSQLEEARTVQMLFSPTRSMDDDPRVIAADSRRLKILEQLGSTQSETGFQLEGAEKSYPGDRSMPMLCTPGPSSSRSIEDDPREYTYSNTNEQFQDAAREFPNALDHCDNGRAIDSLSSQNLELRFQSLQKLLDIETAKSLSLEKQKESCQKELKVLQSRCKIQDKQLSIILEQCQKLCEANEKLQRRAKLLRVDNKKLKRQLDSLNGLAECMSPKIIKNEDSNMSGLPVDQIQAMMSKVYTQAKAAVDAAQLESERYKKQFEDLIYQQKDATDKFVSLEQENLQVQSHVAKLKEQLILQEKALREREDEAAQSKEQERLALERCQLLEEQLGQSKQREERFRQAVSKQSQNLRQFQSPSQQSKEPDTLEIEENQQLANPEEQLDDSGEANSTPRWSEGILPRMVYEPSDSEEEELLIKMEDMKSSFQRFNELVKESRRLDLDSLSRENQPGNEESTRFQETNGNGDSMRNILERGSLKSNTSTPTSRFREAEKAFQDATDQPLYSATHRGVNS